jgi:hypothetical protein
MAKRAVWNKAIDQGTAAATAVVKTDRLENIMIVVQSIGDTVDSAFTMTVTSTPTVDGAVKTAVGLKPVLTGTIDADGAIAYDQNDTTVAYEVVGVHPYLWIAISGVTDVIKVTIWVGGQETV